MGRVGDGDKGSRRGHCCWHWVRGAARQGAESWLDLLKRSSSRRIRESREPGHLRGREKPTKEKEVLAFWREVCKAWALERLDK